MRITRILILLTFLIGYGCNTGQQKPVEVDFSSSTSDRKSHVWDDDLQVLSVAVAPVISPRESFVYYKELFDYLGEELGMKIEFRQRLSYQEVNLLLQRNQVEIAFICTGAYVEASDRMDLLVGPVYHGVPYYHGYVIVSADSDIEHFEDLKGRSFAYTDPISNTGKLYPQKRILQLQEDTSSFFGQLIYSGSHDMSIQMVARGIIDAASVSGPVYDHMIANQPELADNIRIIEVSEAFGTPPVVSSLLLDPEKKKHIKELLLSLHTHHRGRELLESLQVERFSEIDDSMYNSVREINKKVWN
jgi:phosphonate transport system substrate-binding protein